MKCKTAHFLLNLAFTPSQSFNILFSLPHSQNIYFPLVSFLPTYYLEVDSLIYQKLSTFCLSFVTEFSFIRVLNPQDCNFVLCSCKITKISFYYSASQQSPSAQAFRSLVFCPIYRISKYPEVKVNFLFSSWFCIPRDCFPKSLGCHNSSPGPSNRPVFRLNFPRFTGSQ